MQPQDDNKNDWQAPQTESVGLYTNPPTDLPQAVGQLATSDVETDATPREGDEEVVRWQGVEHVQHDKDAIWYLLFGIVVIVFILLAIFVIRSWTFAVLIPVMAAALVVYVMRPPAIMNYTLSRKGLHINDRLYAFGDFREFGLIQDQNNNSIMLMPRKRFQPGVTIYFPEDAGEAIVDMLAARLPMRELKLDTVDRLIRKLRI